MEREKKKKGRGRERERSEDQLVKKNIGSKKKRKLLLQDVKQLNKKTNSNGNYYNINYSNDIIDNCRKEDLDVNGYGHSHHYDNNNIHNDDYYDDDTILSGGNRGVFDFPWLQEQRHGKGSGGGMFSDINADDNYIIDHHHHPFFLGFEEYYYGSTLFAVLPTSTTYSNDRNNYPHNIVNVHDAQRTRVVVPPAPNCDAGYSSTTTTITTNIARASTAAPAASGQSSSSSSSSLPNSGPIDDPKYFDINVNNSNINNHEFELDKMEYYIWSSVLDQPLDIGLFNKYM